jgi:SAM-dependent methyltransferase
MSAGQAVVADEAVVELHLERWRADADVHELRLLASLREPVLDVGCGPGRILAALHHRGRASLGIDLAPSAVREAAARGGAVLCRSVFDPLPREGHWATALLLDGNIGIGGDPAGLLDRVRSLLRPGGEVVAELEPAGGTRLLHARLVVDGNDEHRFPWATVGVGAWEPLAAAAGYTRIRTERVAGRRFGRAVRA